MCNGTGGGHCNYESVALPSADCDGEHHCAGTQCQAYECYCVTDGLCYCNDPF